MLLKDSPNRRSIWRLWQPQRGLFWLMVAFNVLSSAMAWWLHWAQPTGGLLVLVTVMALINALLGWWLLSILWREGAGTTSGENTHVQSIADQQDR